MTYGHDVIAAQQRGWHRMEELAVADAFDAVQKRIADVPVEVALRSVVGKAAKHAKANGVEKRYAIAAIELELDIIRRSW